MHSAGESEQAIVAKKPPNEGLRLLAHCPEEAVEPRACAKGNLRQENTSRTLSRTHDVQNDLLRVRQRAQQDRKAKFTALFHHLTVERLREAFLRLKPRAAAGVDGVRWAD